MFVGLPLVAALGIYNLKEELSHHDEHQEKPDLPYLEIRTKAFPYLS
jgi:hypothetical protein